MIFTYSSSNLFIRKQYITPFSFCKRDIFHSRGLLFSFDWSITRSLCFVNDLVPFFSISTSISKKTLRKSQTSSQRPKKKQPTVAKVATGGWLIFYTARVIIAT